MPTLKRSRPCSPTRGRTSAPTSFVSATCSVTTPTNTSACFFRHTHVRMSCVRDNDVHRQRIDQLRVDQSKKYFINTGSVGQPRDSDWRAAYCIYHIEGAVVEQRRVKYDLATAQKKIIDAGLPRLLAERLAIGR